MFWAPAVCWALFRAWAADEWVTVLSRRLAAVMELKLLWAAERQWTNQRGIPACDKRLVGNSNGALCLRVTRRLLWMGWVEKASEKCHSRWGWMEQGASHDQIRESILDRWNGGCTDSRAGRRLVYFRNMKIGWLQCRQRESVRGGRRVRQGPD